MTEVWVVIQWEDYGPQVIAVCSTAQRAEAVAAGREDRGYHRYVLDEVRP